MRRILVLLRINGKMRRIVLLVRSNDKMRRILLLIGSNGIYGSEASLRRLSSGIRRLRLHF